VKKQLEILKERGLIAQESHAGKVADYLESGPKTFYVGFDPTGESLHVGHLAAIMAMYRLVKFGHKSHLYHRWWNCNDW
jgi:tyrosyl-tRNA synthetase